MKLALSTTVTLGHTPSLPQHMAQIRASNRNSAAYHDLLRSGLE